MTEALFWRTEAERHTREVTHRCPPVDGGGLMPCCELTPFEVPRTDRMTEDPALVTCGTERHAPAERREGRRAAREAEG